ncbi:MAG: hypothetical protein HUJ55_06830 [Ileibacterium sp.]|nr:hypothetical protein [Ileibacterium sp.]
MDLKKMTDDEKYDYMVSLHNQVNDYFLKRFMKMSKNHMDEKIAVLQQRLDGKLPPEIENWDAVQECD